MSDSALRIRSLRSIKSHKSGVRYPWQVRKMARFISEAPRATPSRMSSTCTAAAEFFLYKVGSSTPHRSKLASGSSAPAYSAPVRYARLRSKRMNERRRAGGREHRMDRPDRNYPPPGMSKLGCLAPLPLERDSHLMLSLGSLMHA